MLEVSFRELPGKVYVLVEENRIRPVAVDWGTRRMKVARVSATWIDPNRPNPVATGHSADRRDTEPIPPCHHVRRFSLAMEAGEVLQVSYDEGHFVWKLDRLLGAR
jgi:hypothetical protein